MSPRQHLSCFILNDSVAIDAGSLALAVNDVQRRNVRDIVLTHAHLDHIAGLPLFIDDLFATLESPVRVYATDEVTKILEQNIFNWEIYPRFSELENEFGPVLEYVRIENGNEFCIGSLRFKPLAVNHKVPSTGFIVTCEESALAMSGDTSSMDEFWEHVNSNLSVKSVLLECAFPDELASTAERSYHMTPSMLKRELRKLRREECEIYIINIKPMYRKSVIRQLSAEGRKINILEVGRRYSF